MTVVTTPPQNFDQFTILKNLCLKFQHLFVANPDLISDHDWPAVQGLLELNNPVVPASVLEKVAVSQSEPDKVADKILLEEVLDEVHFPSDPTVDVVEAPQSPIVPDAPNLSGVEPVEPDLAA